MILAISNIIGGYSPPKVIDEFIPAIEDENPIISGDSSVGSELIVISNGNWINNPLFFYYQWKKEDVNIEGETKSTYTTTLGDVGLRIFCYVAATNLKGKSEYVASINSITVSLVAPE